MKQDHDKPESNEVAHAALRITGTTDDAGKVGRLFDAKIIELGLATVPGNAGRGGAGFNGAATIIHWPSTIDSQLVTEKLHISGETVDVPSTQQLNLPEIFYQEVPTGIPPSPGGTTTTIPFGRLFGTRSGDKGGNANCGVWARSDDAYGFLYEYLTVDEFKRLCPDFAQYAIERYDMPNLRAMNFYIRGILGTGAVSNNRIDKQAKSMGEYLRAKHIEVPAALLD